jgi:hypothetical protein
VAQAQRIQIRRALLQRHAAMIGELERYFNPPPAPEREVIYVEPQEETGALSFVKPIRWR